MPFLIPNAGDTTGGNTYAALDQAEPDSLDFEVLGNYASGVFSGCAVSPAGAAVHVTAGVVILRGVPYAVADVPSLALTTTANSHFDIVVARISNAIATVTVVSGADSATNPTYPRSTSIAGLGTLNPDTDVVLAAVLRIGSGSPTTKNIVDKRTLLSSSIPDQGPSAPVSSRPEGPGSLYYQTGVGIGGTTSSGVWVKTGPGNAAWVELAQNIPALSPIGVMNVWPSIQNPPSGWLLCDGRTLSTTTYSALYAIVGTLHNLPADSNPALFRIPDMNHRFLRGTTVAGEVGKTTGADSVTPPLPVHTHTLGSHTHTLSHTHSLVTNPAGAGTTTDGSHMHTFSNNPTPAVTGGVLLSAGAGGTFALAGSGSPVLYASATVQPQIIDPAGSHAHTLTIPALSGGTYGPDNATTSGPTPTTIDPAGVGGSVATIPASLQAQWIIRASLG